MSGKNHLHILKVKQKVTCFADMDKSDVLGSILPVLSGKDKSDTVEYCYYPSEIVRAYENGWLLEIPFGRLDAAKQAAVALYEFCTGCGIPIMVYGDTADRSMLEQMSIYAYVDFDSKDVDEKYALMNIQARSNNRDGMALRIISDRLLNAPQKTKLIISISDGQPKAMPDYTVKRQLMI